MSEEVKTQGQLDAEEERRKSVVDKTADGYINIFYPGHINIALENGAHFSGCAMFDGTREELKRFLDTTRNVLWVGDGVWYDNNNRVTWFYTSKQEKKELELFNKFNRDYAEFLRKNQEEEEAQKVRDEEERIKQESLKREKAEKEEAENRRLIHLGRVHLQNCSKKAKKEKA